MFTRLFKKAGGSPKLPKCGIICENYMFPRRSRVLWKNNRTIIRMMQRDIKNFYRLGKKAPRRTVRYIKSLRHREKKGMSNYRSAFKKAQNGTKGRPGCGKICRRYLFPPIVHRKLRKKLSKKVQRVVLKAMIADMKEFMKRGRRSKRRTLKICRNL